MIEREAKVGDIIETLKTGERAQVLQVGPRVYGEAYPGAVRAKYLDDEVYGIWLSGEYKIVEEGA